MSFTKDELVSMIVESTNPKLRESAAQALYQVGRVQGGEEVRDAISGVLDGSANSEKVSP